MRVSAVHPRWRAADLRRATTSSSYRTSVGVAGRLRGEPPGALVRHGFFMLRAARMSELVRHFWLLLCPADVECTVKSRSSCAARAAAMMSHSPRCAVRSLRVALSLAGLAIVAPAGQALGACNI